MMFYSAFPGARPARLSEATRKFAYDSLQGVWGRHACETPFLSADHIAGFESLSPYGKYDAMINLIASRAPLRICGGELLCGSATLGDAIGHRIPVRYNNELVMHSVSHLTCNFDRVVREGVDSYRDRILKAQPCEFNASLMNFYHAMKIYHKRYLDELISRRDNACGDDKKYYQDLYDNLKNVPFSPPSTFREALQAIWFSFAFLRLCGNWPGIGRLDLMVGKFLENDLKNGIISVNEARELFAHFFIKGCEWICLIPGSRGSGDAQHYQNIVLAGADENNNGIECAGIATQLILEIVEELPISDFPIAVRVNSNSPDWLFRKTSEVIRHGGGTVAIYNENLIIKSLIDFGYSPEEAVRFANDGCWEVQVPGKTCFSYVPIDIYGMYEKEVLKMYGDGECDFADFESLYGAFRKMLADYMAEWHKNQDWFTKVNSPMTAVAFFTDDCIDKSLDYHNGGARYNVISPHLGGVPDVANSMYAIKKLVFEEGKISLKEFINILKDNWENNEDLRLYVRKNYIYYGNDNDEADCIVARIMNDYTGETRKVKSLNGILRPPGISTFGRQIDWKDGRKASAHGFKTGDILASNLSPTPSTDINGAIAVIRSHCKVDYSKLTCGTALDIKLEPSAAETGVIAGLLRAFLKLDGFFLQIDVLDNAVLIEAQKHPENYQNLSVRISGWSARFVTLNDEWQRMIIERTAQNKN